MVFILNLAKISLIITYINTYLFTYLEQKKDFYLCFESLSLMNIAIISSTKDIASTNIKDNLINNFKFNKLEEQFDTNNIYQYTINNNEIIKIYTINSELIYTDDLDKKIDADVFVFISRHRAQEGRANLTCHNIGNFGKAEHGGKEKILCASDPVLLKNIFVELNNNVKEPYEVTLEATHHGPYLEKPVLFVELGSNEEYWKDKEGGNIVAKSVINAIKKYNNSNSTKNENNINSDLKNNNLMEGSFESVFLIGGSHYSHVGNKAMLNSNLAVGHICAKYNLIDLNESLIKQAMEKCRAKFVLLDWKGLGKEKARILEILEKNNIKFKRSDQIFKNKID